MISLDYTFKRKVPMIPKSLFLALTLVFPSLLLAETPQTIVLDNGTTTATLSVANSGDTDLTGVRIVFDRDTLPQWLKVRENDQTLDIPKKGQSEKPFVLIFETKNPPSCISTDIPYTLRDDTGGEWRFSLRIVTGQEVLAFDMSLAGAFPNPFNPGTSIRYSLKDSRHVRLIVFNTLGQAVRTLVDSPQNAGFHDAVWDGRDDNGMTVSSGVYFCRMVAGSYVKTMKMTLME